MLGNRTQKGKQYISVLCEKESVLKQIYVPFLFNDSFTSS